MMLASVALKNSLVWDHLKFPSFVLSISNTNYLLSVGGTEKVILEEQAELARRSISYLHVYPYPSSSFVKADAEQMVGITVDSLPSGFLTIAELERELANVHQQGDRRLLATHIHHLLNWSLGDVLCLVKAARASQQRFFLHDFYTVCPQINLLQNGEEYCGGPAVDSSQCQNCQWGDKRQRLFPQISQFFAGIAADFIAPSRVAAEIWGHSFPQYIERIKVIPHQLTRVLDANKSARPQHGTDSLYRFRVAYVGYMATAKGWETWRQLVTHKALQKRYEFFHFGTGAKLPKVKRIPISYLDHGPNAAIEALLENKIDIAFLWSICPETFSFTLHEALAARCFVVTHHASGNIAAQVVNSSRGAVFDSEEALWAFLSDSDTVIKALQRNFEENPPLALAVNPEVALEIEQGTCAVQAKAIPEAQPLFTLNLRSQSAAPRADNSSLHFFTSITVNYLPKARVLAKSLKQHNPGVIFHLVLSDQVPQEFDIDKEPFDTLVLLEDLDIPDVDAWVFKHGVVELCTAVKGSAFVRIFETTSAEKVIYLDPDIVVLDSLEALSDILDRASIVLTPHQVAPDIKEEAIKDNEISSLKHGVYNLGFIAVKRSAVGIEFVHWWNNRLLEFCYDDIANGLFTDQRWVDLAPAFFDEVFILRDRTYNVATWNLTHRKVECDSQGRLVIDNTPIKFFHFSGFDSGAQKVMLRKYADTDFTLMGLHEWYAGELNKEGQAELGNTPCVYSFYSNGKPIMQSDRRLYRARPDLMRAFPHPATVWEDKPSYYYWLKFMLPKELGISMAETDGSDVEHLRAVIVQQRERIMLLNMERNALIQISSGDYPSIARKIALGIYKLENEIMPPGTAARRVYDQLWRNIKAFVFRTRVGQG